MTWSSRYWRYVTVITILLLFLAVKYIARHGDNNKHDGQSIQDLSIERYTLHADNEVRVSAVKDIFYDVKVQDVSHHTNSISRGTTAPGTMSKSAVPKKIVEPVISENGQNIPATDGEIERVKLLGIVFHENKKKAFVALDRQRMIASVGDTLFGRYLLRDIAVNSVELVDTKDNVQKTILVSGK